MQKYFLNLLLQEQEALADAIAALETITKNNLDISQIEAYIQTQIALRHARDLNDVVMDELRSNPNN